MDGKVQVLNQTMISIQQESKIVVHLIDMLIKKGDLIIVNIFSESY